MTFDNECGIQSCFFACNADANKLRMQWASGNFKTSQIAWANTLSTFCVSICIRTSARKPMCFWNGDNKVVGDFAHNHLARTHICASELRVFIAPFTCFVGFLTHKRCPFESAIKLQISMLFESESKRYVRNAFGLSIYSFVAVPTSHIVVRHYWCPPAVSRYPENKCHD